MSAHFTIKELTDSVKARENGIDNTPGQKELYNLYRTMEALEQVRYILGNKPVHLSNAYRCPALNRLVGGAATSVHMQGLGADFICPEYGSPLNIVKTLMASSLAFDQLIVERNSEGKEWVHIGLSESIYRREVLVYDGKDYRPFKTA